MTAAVVQAVLSAVQLVLCVVVVRNARRAGAAAHRAAEERRATERLLLRVSLRVRRWQDVIRELEEAARFLGVQE